MNSSIKPFLLLLVFLWMIIMGGATGADHVLVIGLDGADWDVIQPLMEEGEMPNLQKLMEEGQHGNLTTTLPVESPVAWTSMSTGTTPGKHGIYGFIERDGNTFVPTTSEDVEQNRVWDYAGEEGEVVVVNVPQTFPPQEVNGSLISGYLSIEDAGYTYPEELQEELERDGYRIETLSDEFEEGKEEEFLERLNVTVEKRTEAAEMLLEREDWRLGWVVYTGLDRLQHYFWKYQGGESDYAEVIDDHYRKLDRQVGELVEQAGDNTTVMVVSDHGFGPLEKNVYLNTWLKKEGYLQLEGEKASGFLADIGLTQQNVVDSLSGLGLLEPVKGFFDFLGFNPGADLPEPGLSDIDLETSRAYAGNYGGKIYLTGNAGDREELLKELEAELESLEDPDTGRKIFEVYRPEEIYTGDMEGAPDLVLESRGPYRAVGFLGHQSVVKQPPEKTGTHRRDGMYILSSGAGDSDADITDISPTILKALGQPVPDEMDGVSILRHPTDR